MLEMTIQSDNKLSDNLSRIHAGLAGLQPLGAEMAAIIVEGNRKGLLAGLDAQRSPMTPVRPRKDGSTGPPLVPHGEASRLIRDFDAIAQVTADGVEIQAGWPEPWESAHATGAGRLPVRDIEGIRPDTMTELLQCVHDFTEGILNASA